MKCDHCDNEATVHELAMRNGIKVERHLCEQCATQHGISVSGTSPIHELLKNFSVQAGLPTPLPGSTPKPTMRAGTCPSCRTTLSDFKQHGLLGCADCYRAFEAQLTPLLERAHDGGVHHNGKRPERLMSAMAASSPASNPGQPATHPPTPERPATDTAMTSVPPAESKPSAAEIAKRAALLQRQLDKAVTEEKYELAAKLRDELLQLKAADPNS